MLVSFGVCTDFPCLATYADPRPLACAFRWFIVRRMQFNSILQSSQSGSLAWPLFPAYGAHLGQHIYILSGLVYILSSHWKDPSSLTSPGQRSFCFQPRLCVRASVLPALGKSRVLLDLTRWSMPACSIVFFLFFGVGEEAVADYKRALVYIGGSSAGNPSPSASNVLPFGSRYVATVGPYDLCDYG